MPVTRRVLSILFAVFFLLPGLLAGAQAYTSVVVFGDSLSDTGNVANLTAAKYTVNFQVPGPATGYTNGRFTDGTDTVPAARNFTGIWVEQLAAMLAAKPAVANSLAGGTDYAYGFATTGVGTSTFTYGPGNVLSVQVNNMDQQVTDYLATRPTITNKTLFIVWGGANDLIAATTQADILAAANRDLGIVQRLIAAGATDFIVPNLPPLGLVPRFNGSPTTSIPATQSALGFDQALAAGLAGLPGANPGKTLHIFPLDTYTLFTTIVGPPVVSPLVNVTASAQGNSTINPDTYLFWDDLHPTTAGHSLIAKAAYTLIGTPVVTTTTVTSSGLAANLNAPVTFTATVTASSGTPIGSVTFLDGSTVLGTGALSGSTTAATATLMTTKLAAGSHSITAMYTGVNGYAGSSSPAITEVVTAPALTAAFVPSTLNVKYGSTGSSTLTLTPVGGYAGTATFACGTLPAHFSCSFSPATLTLAGNQAQSTTLTINAATATGMLAVPAFGHGGSGVVMAFAAFPCMGLIGFAAFRRRELLRKHVGLTVLLVMLSAAAVLGMEGCADNSNPNAAAPGTYSVPVNVMVNGTTTTSSLSVVVQ